MRWLIIIIISSIVSVELFALVITCGYNDVREANIHYGDTVPGKVSVSQKIMK